MSDPGDEMLDYDDLEEFARDCDHDEYSIDTITGRIECDRCPHAWWATDEQIMSEVQRQAEYAEWEAEQHRPWNRFKNWVRQSSPVCWMVSTWRSWTYPRGPRVVLSDDDIPF